MSYNLNVSGNFRKLTLVISTKTYTGCPIVINEREYLGIKASLVKNVKMFQTKVLVRRSDTQCRL